MVRWRTSEQEPVEPHHSRFVTWEELGIDEDTYSRYGSAHFANKPYTPTELTSGAVWAAGWGEAPVRTELPKIKGGTCCRIVGTSAGYFALAELGEPGYPPILDVEPPMFFSADGSNWAAVDNTDVREALGTESAERVSRLSGWLLPWGELSRQRQLLPWREGFLEVGHPVVDGDRVDLTRLFSRISADGLDWSPLEHLPIGLSYPQTDHDRSGWPYRRGVSLVIAASDGERMALAVFGEDTVVAITSDLARWETFEIPAPSREGLPDGVTAEPSMIDLAIGPEGWLLLRVPFFADMSVVTDGIVLNGHLFYPPVYPDPATESESQLWLGDATGTNWRPVELPGLSEGSQFDLRHSRGGAVVKGGKPEDDSVGEWMDDSSVEWMMASRDGVNWLVVEDPTVGDLGGFIVNGNVMLAFDSQGNTHRFLLP